MQLCPHCDKENATTDAYCYSCGHILPSALAAEAATRKLEDIYETLEPQRRWGTAYFDRHKEIELTIRDTGEVLRFPVKLAVVLGRIHSELDAEKPDVDLGPYGAVKKGVSRLHLRMARDYDTIMVTDLGSANHTFLNGQRLLPGEPRILRDNDEVRMGHMVIRVRFV